ncbi:MAG: hypothetical protein LVR00_09770 [Rhabdochlamydiaceae bacterium]|jgi:hypothetical protein
MERFQGSSLAEWKGRLPIEMVQKIATTLSNVANNTKYVYRGAALGDIAVAGDALKFTSFNNFRYSRSWQSALDSYNDLYNFFIKLVNLMPKKEKWIEKLNLIFSFRDLAATYWKADSNTRKSLEESHKDIFNIELLQRTLAQVQALFSSAKGG